MQRLDLQLLCALEREWERQGAPVRARLRPGLTSRRAQELVTPLGITLPPEAARWWTWHDGAEYDPRRQRGGREIGPLGEFYTLEEAVAKTFQLRRLAADIDRHDGPYRMWWPELVVLTTTRHGSTVACDCTDPEADITPIRVIDPELPEQYLQPARSFGEAVTWWIDAMRAGGWIFDRELDQWLASADGLDTDRERLTQLL